jgi:hypothetical protein
MPNRRDPAGLPPDHGVPRASGAGPVFEPPPPRRNRVDRGMRSDLGLVAFLLVAAVVGIAAWNLAGRVTRQVLHPPATAAALVAVATPTPNPTVRASPSPDVPASADPSPVASATPPPSPKPKPARRAISYHVDTRPARVFVSELEKTWCAAAAVQIALNITGDHVDTSRARQVQILDELRATTTRADSRNGGAGPLGMVATLGRLGGVDYALRIYPTRAAALRGAAKAIATTRHPAILLAWRGAHAWVMNGFRADADPRFFGDASVTGAYIIDPWYPRVSTIWGPSDGPGVFQDAAEMRRNFLRWRRPEGHYPGRDGRFLVVVPTT